MPDKERGRTPPPKPVREELEHYEKASKFVGEEPAGLAYAEAQEVIYTDTSCDLSTYRLQLNEEWHVAVLGLKPQEQTLRRLEDILATGEPTTLPAEIMSYLRRRRTIMTKKATWVERHYGNPPKRRRTR